MAELDAAGAFRKKGDGGGEKRGTVNTVAGEETNDDSGGSASDTKTEETSTSDLTDGSPDAPWPTYKELLRGTGYINTMVGVEDAISGDYDIQNGWDGDDLASLGLGFLEVQGENQGVTLPKQGVSFLEDGAWHIQGHRGSNPVKKRETVSPVLKEGSSSKPAWIVESCLRSKKNPGTIKSSRAVVKEGTGGRVLGRAKKLAAKLIINAKESAPARVNPRQAQNTNRGSARTKLTGKGYSAVTKSR